MTTLNTNFNISPYFDDFDETKDFYRILYRPSVPVQARELNQTQNILQKQIERFGGHIFKEGSVVEGCHVTYHNPMKYVSVKNNFYANSAMTVAAIDKTVLLVGNTSGVRAVALASKIGYESAFPYSNRLYINYLTSGANSSSEFQRNEYIKVYSSSQDKLGTLNSGNYVDQILTIDQPTTVGNAYGVTVGDGTIYHKAHFLRVSTSTIVVKDFDVDPTNYRVGFDTAENIINEDQDPSLNDNALGYPNLNAPGAHRLKLTPFLVSKLRSDDSKNKNFFAIVEFDGQSATEQNNTSAYNQLGDEFALRTYEKSGNFVSKPFSIETFPGVNANTAQVDANLFSYAISSGTAYVRGYRIDKISTSNVVTTRAKTTKTSKSQIVTANYGNYVYVKEMMGDFDWKNLQEVSLYDATQNTITDQEKASGARAGNIIGKAIVRAVNFNSGTKGIPTGQYSLYLDNIRMNSGKSFTRDVKSVYGTSANYGAARADIVPVINFYANGSTFTYSPLFDSARNLMVFGTGTSALRSFSDNSGATNTQFAFNDVANATLNVNGFISVALNIPSAGGPERVNASGTLTASLEKAQFDVVLSTDVLTSNLTGTVAITAAQSNVIGTGTSFNTVYKTGDYISVNHQSGSDRRMVSSITNATHLIVTGLASVTNASASYAKLYLEGTHLDLSNSTANVVITSNTTFSINTGITPTTLTAASNTFITFPVLKRNTYPVKKDVYTGNFIKLDCSNNTANSVGPWLLGIPDVYKIESVYVGTTFSEANPDYSSWFALDTGQRDSTYELAQLFVKPQYASNLSAATKLLVKFSCLSANASSGVGFFSIDSYPIANGQMKIEEIPSYTDSTGNILELRDCVDYRPYRVNTAARSVLSASANTNPPVANLTNYSTGTYGFVPIPDTNFQADLTYYLPRRDLVVVNHVGDFSVINGEPSEFPLLPSADLDVMVVAEAFVPPWPSLTGRESVAVSKPSLKILHDIKSNRRYTERDIGVLDNRLKNVEYYAVLNALEQKSKDMTIPDVTGIDRFKNGIFADPLNGHGIGRVSDFEYKIAIDGDNSIARPFFKKTSIDYKYDTSLSTSQKVGNSVLAPFTNVIYVLQNYASKVRNCTESQWAWTGKMNLYPSYDGSRDETSLPNVNVVIDNAAAWADFASSPFASTFGDWRTRTSSSTSVSGLTSTTTSTTTQDRTVRTLKVDTTSSKQDLGKYVTDVSIQPFMKSRLISFVATNLKPNTRLHAFFDDVLVDQHVAPAVISGITAPEAGREDKILNRSGNFGDALFSDSIGVVRGIFRIPVATFRNGDRILKVTDASSNVDSPLTSADARFTAANLAVTTQGISINNIEPEISSSTRVQTIINSTRTTEVSVAVAGPSNVGVGSGGGPSRDNTGRDPIAQSFFVESPEGTSGMFMTKLTVFFKSKDANLGVTAMICETRLGDPDTSKIMATKHLESSEVLVSADGTVGTEIVFREPVFVTAGNYFCFLIKPDGDSPEYRIWLGETGGYDVSTGVQIYQNPYTGVAFLSSNMNSWTALQKEDIKFILHRAEFTTGSSVAYFNNESDDFLRFNSLLRANTSTTIQVGDLVYTGNTTDTFVGANTLQPYGIVQSVSETEGTVTLDSSTGGWSANGAILKFHRPSAVGNSSLISNTSLLATANLTVVDNINYHVVVPRFSMIKPARTAVSYAYSGTSNTGIVDSFITITNDQDYEFRDTTRIVKSFSNEASVKSSKYAITLSTNSKYVSPMIDLRRKSSFAIENLINNDLTGEDVSRYGKASTKYVSKIITLATGQDAEDILVTVSAYRPAGTDVVVYVKFLCGDDGDPIDSKAWTLLTASTGAYQYSNPLDTSNYIDFDYKVPLIVPAGNPTGAALDVNGILSYTSTTGSVFHSYKNYMIKVVLLSTNPARIPLINSIRAIAMQV